MHTVLVPVLVPVSGYLMRRSRSRAVPPVHTALERRLSTTAVLVSDPFPIICLVALGVLLRHAVDRVPPADAAIGNVRARSDTHDALAPTCPASARSFFFLFHAPGSLSDLFERHTARAVPPAGRAARKHELLAQLALARGRWWLRRVVLRSRRRRGVRVEWLAVRADFRQAFFVCWQSDILVDECALSVSTCDSHARAQHSPRGERQAGWHA